MSNVHCVGCPEDFTYNASANSCYKVSDMMEWSAAGPLCQMIDGRAYLAIITSMDQMAAVEAVIHASDG